jgi:hypothetical protein
MSRSLTRRLAGLEKQVAGTVAGPQYPPIPSMAERKRMTLHELQALWERVRRGEYSISPVDVESRPAMDLEGKSPQELAKAYAKSCDKTWEVARRERGAE